jgi:hypothetical protein
MPKSKDKIKSKIKNKSKNNKNKNKNKNKNTINIKIIGGQGGGGGGGGASSHIPHAPHHQDIDYDRIRNIIHQAAPRSTLTQETVNPPPVHQAVDITPNVSTYQNMQIPRTQLYTPPHSPPQRTTAIDYDTNINVGQMSAQTAPIVNSIFFKKDDELDSNDQEESNLNITGVYTKEQEKRNINNANYDEYRDLRDQCAAAGNFKVYKNTVPGKRAMIKWLSENTKTG